MSDVDPITITNGKTTVQFDRITGCIVQLADETRHIRLVREPRLAENFRLLVPLPELRGHYILGRDQTLTEHLAEGTASCWLTWHGLRSEHGTFDLTVSQRFEVTPTGDVHVQTTVDNASGYVVEEVHNVTLGGLAAEPDQRQAWRLHYANHVGQGTEWKVFDEFPGSYLGPEKPVWIGAYHGDLSLPWIDLYNGERQHGVYFGNHDLEPRQAYIFCELSPCTTYRGSADQPQFWPDPDHTRDTPVGLSVSWVSIPFLGQESWSGPEIDIHFHDGTWWEAARHYRAWWDQHFTMPANRSWLADEDAWQSTIISYPDDTVGYTFADLPELAKAAADVGIHVLQLDGWDVGGIDRDYPRYEPDPRLGTWDDLRNALTECRRIGVKVLLFANLQWVNIETDWFAAELSRYVTRDPYGNIRGGMGWQYRTVLGLKNQTIHRMIPANCARPEFQQVILAQLGHLVDLGADGVQLDKLGAMSEIDYAEDNPLPRDRSGPVGVIDTLRKFVDAARERDPHFAIASEVHWDRIAPTIDASYSRFFSTDHSPTYGTVFPEYRQSCCVTGRWDFGLVNNCLRFGHIVNLEGDCLHGSAASLPELSPYVAEVLRLRRRLRHRIWDSRLIDPTLITGLPNDVYAGLHESHVDSSLTVVLNHFQRTDRVVELTGLAGATEAVIHRPFEEADRVALPATVTVPVDRAVVVELVGARA